MDTQQDIIDQIETEAATHTELTELEANQSFVSSWVVIKNVMATVILTLQNLFESHKAEVQEIVEDTQSGTLEWLRNKCLEFQDGDVLIVSNDTVKYNTVDVDKRLIARVAIVESSGGAEVRVAKTKPADAFGTVLEKLEDSELLRFRDYISKIKIIGTILNVTSTDPDELILSYTIEVERELYDGFGRYLPTGEFLPGNAIGEYARNFNTEDVLYISKIEDAIQEVEGVIDVQIRSASVNGIAFDRKFTGLTSSFLVFTKGTGSYVLS